MAHIQKLWYHVNSLGTWRSLVARLFWEQDVAGSNPVVPTIFCGCGSMVEPEPSKLVTRVRFPSSAPMWAGISRVNLRLIKSMTLRSLGFYSLDFPTNCLAHIEADLELFMILLARSVKKLARNSWSGDKWAFLSRKSARPDYFSLTLVYPSCSLRFPHELPRSHWSGPGVFFMAAMNVNPA